MPETQQIMKETGSTAEHRVEEELQKEPAQDLSNIQLPFTVEGVTLISPGTWNSKQYPEQEIRQAVQRTDFSDPNVRSLFNEHDDEDSRDWIGEVRNIRMEGEELVGDLDIVTAEEARKLAYGARFGISAKVTGRDARDTMRDFRYDNFSLVLDPAVKTTFINSDNSKNDSDEDTATLKNVTVKSTMSEDSTELSEEELQKIEELAETVENADVEDLAKIMSPFMGMEPSELSEHIADMVDNAEDEEEMSEDVEAIDVEEVADKVADRVSAEMEDEEDEEEDEADEAEESLSVDEIADKVAAQLEEDEEEPEDDAEDSDEELSVDEVVSEVKDEIKEELESVKEELSADEEDDEDEDDEEDAEAEKTPNPGSQATGTDSKELEEKVKELDAEDLDKGMARHMLRSQSSSLR